MSRRLLFRGVKEDDPRARCARFDCGIRCDSHGYDSAGLSGPSHDYQLPSDLRMIARTVYRWATARRRLQEELDATRGRLWTTQERMKVAADRPARLDLLEVVDG